MPTWLSADSCEKQNGKKSSWKALYIVIFYRKQALIAVKNHYKTDLFKIRNKA